MEPDWVTDREDTGLASDAAGGTRTCAYCGDHSELDEWQPVVTRTDDDGELQIYSFCDETCRAAWESAQD